MKKVALVCFGLILLWACQSPGTNRSSIKQTKEIIVYGSNNCDHCVDFKAQLDSIGFSYDFRDVEFDEAMNNELYRKVRAARIMTRINYPVIDIEGKILVAPSLGEVIGLM
jgi:glutaredoxin